MEHQMLPSVRSQPLDYDAQGVSADRVLQNVVVQTGPRSAHAPRWWRVPSWPRSEGTVQVLL